MIDPYNITNFDRSDHELQEFWLFCIIVAGKVAKTQAKKLEQFLDYTIEWTPEDHPELPFDKISHMMLNGILEDRLIECKMGQYSRIVRSFEQSIKLDLRTCSIDDLENIYGVSFKTSRFFMMHTRPDMKIAALDTHILKYLKFRGYDVPKVTPSSKSTYKGLENIFLSIAATSGMSIAEFDLKIWSHYADRSEHSPEF